MGSPADSMAIAACFGKRAVVYDCRSQPVAELGSENAESPSLGETAQLAAHVSATLTVVRLADGIECASTPLFARPAGSELQYLAHGELLVVTDVPSAFADGQDFQKVAAYLVGRGVTVSIPALRLTITDNGQLALIAVYAEAERAKRARNLERTWASRRARGRVTTNVAPSGFKIVGRTRRKKIVRDERQAEAIAEIQRLLAEGHGPWSIRRTLHDAGFVHPHTRVPWTIRQVRRAIEFAQFDSVAAP